MDDPPRPGLPPRPHPAPAPPHRDPRRAARPLRPGEPPRGGVAGGGVHRREPAVPGREAAPARPRRRLRRDAVRGLRRPPARHERLLLLLAREGARRDRSRAGRGAPACWRPSRSAAARTAASSSGSRRPATSSSPDRTSRGSSRAPNVHISFVGQDDGTETERELDGQPVAAINAEPDVGRRPHAGAPAARERSGSPSSATRRAARSTSPARLAARLLAAAEPGRPLERRCRPAVGQRHGHHAAARATCGSSTSAWT